MIEKKNTNIKNVSTIWQENISVVNFLRQSLMLFNIKGFRTIVLLFIIISTQQDT